VELAGLAEPMTGGGMIRSASGELAIQRSLRVRKRGRARAVRFVRSSLSARRLRGPSRTTGTKKGYQSAYAGTAPR
jgi:hypothetical protein